MIPEHKSEHTEEVIEVPAPTFWPFVTAFGIALLCAGLVTNIAVSVVGLVVVLRGATGWFREVLPVPRADFVRVIRPEIPVAVARSTRRVDHLQPGLERHRVNIPVEVHPYSAGLLGGVIGGVGMAIIACLYGLIAQGSLWYPINLLAAAALPSLASAGTEQLKAFHMSGLIVALISHGVISHSWVCPTPQYSQ